jgi:hypothetical protein
MQTLKVPILAVAACLLTPSAFAQNWTKQEKTDAFSGTKFIQYTLPGKFLTPPQHGTLSAPALILQCVPGEAKYSKGWYSAGKLIKGWIDVGASINSTIDGVPVMYRRDDGKAQSELWSKSTDLVALFPSGLELNHILFAHDLIHKVNTTPPVHKLVLMTDEFMGTGIVMQFDLTDLEGSDSIASQCGLAIYPKK